MVSGMVASSYALYFYVSVAFASFAFLVLGTARNVVLHLHTAGERKQVVCPVVESNQTQGFAHKAPKFEIRGAVGDILFSVHSFTSAFSYIPGRHRKG